jgi:SAM-dependent methyltransferase
MTLDTIALLRCMKCGGDLRPDGESFVCSACGARISTVNGAASFVSTSAAHPSDNVPDSVTVRLKNALKRYRSLYNLFMYVFGVSNAGLSPKAFLKKHHKPGQIAVNLGAGTMKKYAGELHVDLYAFPDMDILADLRHLPFKDACLDEVICQSVLEHVAEPDEVLAEITRILKPGGYCYLTTPFMYPYHSSPDDYWRWTLDGLRYLLTSRGYDLIDSGLRHGPTGALSLLFSHWVAAICSFGSKRLYELIVLLGVLVLAPIAHLFDAVLNRVPASTAIASGFFVVGRKR